MNFNWCCSILEYVGFLCYLTEKMVRIRTCVARACLLCHLNLQISVRSNKPDRRVPSSPIGWQPSPMGWLAGPTNHLTRRSHHQPDRPVPPLTWRDGPTTDLVGESHKSTPQFTWQGDPTTWRDGPTTDLTVRSHGRPHKSPDRLVPQADLVIGPTGWEGGPTGWRFWN
jgi:hypothetical protein